MELFVEGMQGILFLDMEGTKSYRENLIKVEDKMICQHLK